MIQSPGGGAHHLILRANTGFNEPGAGSVINAGVAGALTGATGEGWLRLCEQVHTGKLDLDQMNEAWGDYVPGFLDVIRKMATQRLGK